MLKISRSVLFFIATMLMYLGVSLLGWGLGGLGEFFASAPRQGYAIAVTLFSLAIAVQAFPGVEGIRGKKGEPGKYVFRQTVVRYIAEISMYLALFFIPFFDRRGVGVFAEVGGLRWLGVVFSLLGYGLIFWSGLVLGRQYSADVTLQENHHLITNSIYRYIRHPRYLGIIALSIGVACVFRSWVGLLATIYFLVLLLFRIRDEEATMHQEFGVEWEDYCQHTWRLLPYIF